MDISLFHQISAASPNGRRIAPLLAGKINGLHYTSQNVNLGDSGTEIPWLIWRANGVNDNPVPPIGL